MEDHTDHTDPYKPYSFKFFKGCLPQILLGPLLNTLSYVRLLLFSFQYCITNFSYHFLKKKCSENLLLYQAQP